MFWFRRGKLEENEVRVVLSVPAEEEEATLLSAPRHLTTNNDVMHNSQDYSYTDTPLDLPEGQYDHLERSGRSLRKAQASDENEYAHADMTTQEVTYDDTNSKRKRKSTDVESDSLYDHAGDEDYEISGKGNEYADDTYEHAANDSQVTWRTHEFHLETNYYVLLWIKENFLLTEHVRYHVF